MSPDAMNIAIDLHLGIKHCPRCDDPQCAYNTRKDYAGDLNAMREAEMALNTDDSHAYYWRLERELGWEYPSATALQRAEYFLRTIGKWEEVPA